MVRVVFPPAIRSASGSVPAARLGHELATARAPLAGPERPPVPPSALRSRGDKGGGWFSPTKTSALGSVRVARLGHELATARAPLAGPERPPVPPESLRSGGDKGGG